MTGLQPWLVQSLVSGAISLGTRLLGNHFTNKQKQKQKTMKQQLNIEEKKKKQQQKALKGAVSKVTGSVKMPHAVYDDPGKSKMFMDLVHQKQRQLGHSVKLQVENVDPQIYQVTQAQWKDPEKRKFHEQKKRMKQAFTGKKLKIIVV